MSSTSGEKSNMPAWGRTLRSGREERLGQAVEELADGLLELRVDPAHEHAAQHHQPGGGDQRLQQDAEEVFHSRSSFARSGRASAAPRRAPGRHAPAYCLPRWRPRSRRSCPSRGPGQGADRRPAAAPRARAGGRRWAAPPRRRRCSKPTVMRPRDLEVGQGQQPRQLALEGLGREAGLGRVGVDVDLQVDRQPRRPSASRARRPAGPAAPRARRESTDSMTSKSSTALAALFFWRCPTRCQRGRAQERDLAGRLLHPVLSEQVVSGGLRQAQPLHGDGLGDGHEGGGVRAPARNARRPPPCARGPRRGQRPARRWPARRAGRDQRSWAGSAAAAQERRDVEILFLGGAADSPAATGSPLETGTATACLASVSPSDSSWSPAAVRWRASSCMKSRFSRPACTPPRRCSARLRCRVGAGAVAVEAGGDDGDLELVAHALVDDGAEDDVGLRVGHLLDDLGRLVDLEEAQVGTAGDVEEDALGAADADLEQRAADGLASGFGGAVGRRWHGRCP